MRLTLQGLISDRESWKKANIALPKNDLAAMREKTAKSPKWVHFGAGNIFRGFIAALQQKLLDEGLDDTGIIAAETFDYEIIKKIYDPFDCLTLMVTLRASGKMDMNVIASIAQGIRADSSDSAEWAKLKAVFVNPSLQMVSYTITEKGYALRDMKG
ncbi:MAG: mannitol dehydrogenase family protein, partial [Synergistaceae bacterium]|nr:mannitol dehydrogenase family protein [Synergistaceae bacterium]